ncbi:hypothetical protein [Calidifontibacter terrae]
MKLYAELRPRLARQIVFDLVVAGWLIWWIRLGMRVNSKADGARAGADKLQTGAAGLSSNLNTAGGRLEKVPLVGGTLREPFTNAAKSATDLSASGRQMSTGIDQLGDLLGFLTALAPVLFALLLWTVVRLRYARRAGAAARLRAAGGSDLLALRALGSADPARVVAVDPEATAKWREGDEVVINDLAALHLRSWGLRPIHD